VTKIKHFLSFEKAKGRKKKLRLKLFFMQVLFHHMQTKLT